MSEQPETSTRGAPQQGGQTPTDRKAAIEKKITRRVKDWLEEKGIDRCPACSKGPLLTTKRIYEMNASILVPGHGERSWPVVRVRCGNCAHVMLFHARHLGLIR